MIFPINTYKYITQKRDIFSNKQKKTFGPDVKASITKGISYICNNPEKIGVAIGATTALLRASQSIVVSHRVKSEQRRMERSYYDPSSRMHWDLRRKLNNYEKSELIRRRKNGENSYDILRDFGVL